MDLSETKVAVEAYLLKQNRPFSTQDILNCFQTTMKKKNCEAALDALVSEKKVTLKEYGKAKVFLISQDRFPKVDPKLLEDLDQKITAKREELNSVNEVTKELDKSLKETNQTLTNEQMV